MSSVAIWAAVAVAGGLGAGARVLVDAAVTRRLRGPAALGTLAVNLSGSLLFGLLVGLAPGTDTLRIAGVGALGGYTTFSTWLVDTQRLARGSRTAAAANLVGALAGGLLLALAGRALGERV